MPVPEIVDVAVLVVVKVAFHTIPTSATASKTAMYVRSNIVHLLDHILYLPACL